MHIGLNLRIFLFPPRRSVKKAQQKKNCRKFCDNSNFILKTFSSPQPLLAAVPRVASALHWE